ncbi:MAG: hypothetical protein A4S08_07620 [Proteobacteria bacterium SG_bin4]|nr:MAG: hypothetical protein A4S08_07620 [Proteobacteria bacterium SG_bin4]
MYIVIHAVNFVILPTLIVQTGKHQFAQVISLLLAFHYRHKRTVFFDPDQQRVTLIAAVLTYSEYEALRNKPSHRF